MNGEHKATAGSGAPADPPSGEWVRLMRLPDVLENVGLGRTAWFNLVRAGVAPRPIRIGRAVAWPSNEVQAFIHARIAQGRGGAR
jgi:prophage regulatory protein